MLRIAEIRLPLPDALQPPQAPMAAQFETPLRQAAVVRLGVPPEAITHVQVYKRSFDARKHRVQQVFIVDVALAAPHTAEAVLAQVRDPHIQPTPDMRWHPPVQVPAHSASQMPFRPVVVGFGPCGMLAALCLAQMGLRPIVLERGATVRKRTQDTWGLWRKQVLTPESNVQFGEGGAGTFSDGKLYSQIKDPRHLGRKVMQEFVQAGAPEDILYVARPHIGTFRLVKVVENIRQRIEALGGEVRFQQRVLDVERDSNGHLCALHVLDVCSGHTAVLPTRAAILALGHSARDTFASLHQRGVPMQAKAFSIGFRIEHPQSLIDRARWGRHAGNPLLGAADYKLVHHASNGRTVYSFCMCPGGAVVAATSEAGRVVTNGMSQYSRSERNANAGLVVGISPADFPPLDARLPAADALAQAEALPASVLERPQPASPTAVHPLAGIALQRILETQAFIMGGGNYHAPAQTVGDFLAQTPSVRLGQVQPSYRPGVHLTDLTHALPAYATDAMREALPAFGRKIKGYDWADAVLTGVETRTSSPIHIHRDPHTLQSPGLPGLYPAGEGAGYAGGILSAAVDGIKAAEAVAQAMVGTAAAGNWQPAPAST